MVCEEKSFFFFYAALLLVLVVAVFLAGERCDVRNEICVDGFSLKLE